MCLGGSEPSQGCCVAKHARGESCEEEKNAIVGDKFNACDGERLLATECMTQKRKEEDKKKVDSTPHCSRVVPHPSTKRAQTALTSVFG